MKNLNRRMATTGIVAGVIMASQATHAMSFGVEARSLAMGNASVASADIAAAALTNPARLALLKSNDFALLLPAVGAFIDDSDGVTDLVDDFQGDLSACEASGDIGGQQCGLVIDAVNSLASGKMISPQASLSAVLGVSGDTFSFAISAKTDVLLAGGFDPNTYNVSSISALQSSVNNQLALFGVQMTEVGISVATSLNVAGVDIAVGVTPKIIQVDSLVYRQSVSSSSTDLDDLLDEDAITDLGDVTTLDAGVLLTFTEKIQLGVVAKNLLTEDFFDPNDPFGTVTLKFDTQLRAGIAYNGDIITLGVDVDLTENTVISSAFGDVKTQFVSAGLEFDAFDILQLRAGVQENIASGVNDDPLFTAGVGLSVGLHVDVAVITNGDNVHGLFLQTGLRF